MAEATFLPSTTYGLDPTQIAGRVANTAATVAQTQATRQSMMERAQSMRQRQAQEQRVDAEFKQQQDDRAMLMPAIVAKTRNDQATANAEYGHFLQSQNLQTEWQTQSVPLGQEYINLAAIEDNKARGIAMSRFSAKLAKYAGAGVKEAMGLQNLASKLQDASFNESTKLATQTAMTDRAIYMQDEITKRTASELELRKQIAEQKAASESDKAKQGGLIQRHRALTTEANQKRSILNDKIKAQSITPEDALKEWDSIYAKQREAADILTGGDGQSTAPEQRQLVRQKSTGKVGYIVNGEFIEETQNGR